MKDAAPNAGTATGSLVRKYWGRHRSAIAPFTSRSTTDDSCSGWARQWLVTRDPVEDFLELNGLGALWLQALRRGLPDMVTSGGEWSRMRRAEQACSALYMVQAAATREIASLLDARLVPFALMKGAAWRDEIYDSPYLRVAADVDILIERSALEPARVALAELGFSKAGDVDSGHEETWIRGSVDIDLHWDILAPGRTVTPMTSRFLSRRVLNADGVWRLGDDDMVAVLLIHTAVAKYVCCRHSALNRVVDLLYAVAEKQIDWDKVAETVESCGLRGAAWATMTWIDDLLVGQERGQGPVFPDQFRCRLRPSRWRRAYLEAWVHRNWPGRLEPRHSMMVQVMFTLPMHDSLRAVLRAIRGRLGRVAA